MMKLRIPHGLLVLRNRGIVMFKHLLVLLTATTAIYGAAFLERDEFEARSYIAKKFIESRFFLDYDQGYDSDKEILPHVIPDKVPVKFYLLDHVRSPKDIVFYIHRLMSCEIGLIWRFDYDKVNGRARINGYKH
jgi:hypothetical protein